MYNHNAATVSGIYRQVLKPFFESEISDEQGHALYLAEKIKDARWYTYYDPFTSETSKRC